MRARRQRAKLRRRFPGHYRAVGHAQLLKYAPGRARHERLHKHRYRTHALGQRVQHRAQPRLALIGAAQHPGLSYINILVAVAYQLPYLSQSVIGLHEIHVLLYQRRQRMHALYQRRFDLGVLARRGYLAAKVLLYHGHRAADQIAQVIGQVGVYAPQQRRRGKLAVRGEVGLAQQEVAYRIRRVPLAQHHRIHDVAQRFGHLHAVEHQPAMPEYLLGQRQVQHLEHDRPDNRMEPGLSPCRRCGLSAGQYLSYSSVLSEP